MDRSIWRKEAAETECQCQAIVVTRREGDGERRRRGTNRVITNARRAEVRNGSRDSLAGRRCGDGDLFAAVGPAGVPFGRQRDDACRVGIDAKKTKKTGQLKRAREKELQKVERETNVPQAVGDSGASRQHMLKQKEGRMQREQGKMAYLLRHRPECSR
jgi:hypothetical protein